MFALCTGHSAPQVPGQCAPNAHALARYRTHTYILRVRVRLGERLNVRLMHRHCASRSMFHCAHQAQVLVRFRARVSVRLMYIPWCASAHSSDTSSSALRSWALCASYTRLGAYKHGSMRALYVGTYVPHNQAMVRLGTGINVRLMQEVSMRLTTRQWFGSEHGSMCAPYIGTYAPHTQAIVRLGTRLNVRLMQGTYAPHDQTWIASEHESICASCIGTWGASHGSPRSMGQCAPHTLYATYML